MPRQDVRKRTPASRAEELRLEEDVRREKNWKRWGPYLAERQWGTVREDYSEHGTCWDYFPHEQSRSRAYRWGEDGLLGITDRECRLCFALALWNGQDPYLKERLFGLTGPEGNHGEDVKEQYFYLDSTPTHSYCKALYKYPQRAFPYEQLLRVNRERGREQPELEITDTDAFRDGRYFDVLAEYAKGSPNDLLIRITVSNRGPDAAPIHVLPTLWFRNTWSWGCTHEGCTVKPKLLRAEGGAGITAIHPTLRFYHLAVDSGPEAEQPELLFTENETNFQRAFGVESQGPFTKDAFHDFVVGAHTGAVNPAGVGTKAAACYALVLPAGASATLRLRLSAEDERPRKPFGQGFEALFQQRIREADAFYDLRHRGLSPEQAAVSRQAYAGLLWSRQFYHYVVKDWIDGDPSQPPPPAARKQGRNADWGHLFNRDVISMPDKWEYPWYAAWDLAFHMIPFAHIDAQFAKDQLILFLREWYMHPNGQIPAYEFAMGDVNPPVHAWAAWRVYKMTGARGKRDRAFLARVFQKLLLNFTWWVNRKDPGGRHLFSGGFLGLDNIGVFDRNKPLPTGGHLEQADGTAWMAFYCSTMLSIALELAREDPVYQDVASKFFEHFVAIVDAMNTLGGTGLWDEADGFYYDQIRVDGHVIPLRVRSMVGIIPLFAVEVLEEAVIERLPGFARRMQWFLTHRKDLGRHISIMAERLPDGGSELHRLLAIPSKERLLRVLRYLLDEREFLSPYGIRSLSRVHKDKPFVLQADGQEYRVEYSPGESQTGLFGGNSNWRGPIWFPLNYLLVEALQRYHHFYGDQLLVECPTGSGQQMHLLDVARELTRRLTRPFLPDSNGHRPCHGEQRQFSHDPHWRDLVLFHEYFHGDTGMGLGASHQTGWTALVARLLEKR